MKSGAKRKEGKAIDKRTANELLQKYPNFIPLSVASKLLGVSPRQLSKLIASGREPFSLFGADIGTSQHYVRVYTGRLIAYLNGELPMD